MMEKKPTINDIAAMVGVSKATVSMVISKKDQNISEQTRTKILQAAKKIGYVPNLAARSLNTKMSGTIGVIVPDITNPFFAQLARAVEDTASGADYSVILCNSDNSPQKETAYANLLVSKQADGIILMSGGKDRRPIEIFKQNGVPCVPVDRCVKGYPEETGVSCDSQAGIAEAVRYLYEKGKRDIAFVGEQSRTSVFGQRRDAYIRVMTEYGIFKNHMAEGSLDLLGGAKATKEILSTAKNADAILYCADIMAIGGLKLLAENHIRIPGEMGVMGFDNIQMAGYTSPGLTTMAQPVYEMGKTACEILFSSLLGNETAKKIVFMPRLIVRDSV